MAKEIKKIICTVCPKGCNITAETENGEVTSVSGYTCKRGEIYAKAECVNPVRVLTTTMLTDKNTVIPVKTEEAIPKKLLMECMAIINSTAVKTPVNVGDVLISDILGTGVNVIATAQA